jgi:transglycosylase-like protein with SLT domain
LWSVIDLVKSKIDEIKRSLPDGVELVPVYDRSDLIIRSAGDKPGRDREALVESGGRVSAISHKGALGIWQFMPETARRYGLVVTPGLDERVDIVKSTHAAAHYLRDLYTQFGDWNLAFAAYNAGEHAVERAMQRGTRDFNTMNSGHTLPLETRNYVPAVLAAVHLLGGALPERARPQTGSNSALVLYAESTPGN